MKRFCTLVCLAMLTGALVGCPASTTSDSSPNKGGSTASGTGSGGSSETNASGNSGSAGSSASETGTGSGTKGPQGMPNNVKKPR